MTTDRPAIVVTLPARTAAEAETQIREAKQGGADIAEVRIDRLAPGEMERLDRLFPSPLPLMATLRSRSEGGEGPDEGNLREPVLRELSRKPFRWIDVESARDLPAAEALHRPGVRELVVSTHYPGSVSPRAWAEELRRTVPSGALRKVVAYSNVGQLLQELLPALPPPSECASVAMTTGPSGPLLRAWAKRFALPLVYAALPERSEPRPKDAVEPSQIPVDRLRRFFEAGDAAPLFAIVGHPVSHSRSPSLHARFMERRGQAGLYVALDFGSEEEFVDSLPSLVEGGFRGLNITHPFKEVAFELADEVGSGAAACGVANLLTFAPDGTEAENTDLAAVLRRMEELRSSGSWDGEQVGVIGAGGAARATLAAARTLGVPAVVWARKREEAEKLSHVFSAEPAQDPSAFRPSLVVHATTVGRDRPGVATPPDLSWIRPGTHVLDWVYDAEDPILRSTAERAGATYEDGSRLVVYQAAESYSLWWGSEPSPDELSAMAGGAP